MSALLFIILIVSIVLIVSTLFTLIILRGNKVDMILFILNDAMFAYTENLLRKLSDPVDVTIEEYKNFKKYLELYRNFDLNKAYSKMMFSFKNPKRFTKFFEKDYCIMISEGLKLLERERKGEE